MTLSEATVEVVGNIVYGLVTGVLVIVSVVVTNRNQKTQHEADARSRQRELLRSRGEELYEIVDTWLHGLFAYHMRRNFVMQGKLTMQQCIEMESEMEKGANFHRLEMIVDVYFPGVRAAYDDAIAARGAANDIVAEHRRAWDDGIQGESFLGPFVRAQQNVEASGEQLQKQIREAIRTI